MGFDIGKASIIGSREEQQDAMLCITDGQRVLAAVCDGMGGLHGGSDASQTAVERLGQLYRQKEPDLSAPDFYLRSVDILDETIFRMRDPHEPQSRPGTTIVSAAIDGNMLHWLSIGDSRMYIVRNRDMVRVTTDHNYFMLLDRSLANGEISPEEYRAESCRGEALISYLGIRGIEYMDINQNPLALLPGDTILMMTDGLYRNVSESEIVRMVREGGSAQETVDCLIRMSSANAKGNQDNTTLIMIKFTGEKRL